MATTEGLQRVTPVFLSTAQIVGITESGSTTTTRLTDFNIPEMCGFKDRTTPFACPVGKGYTCMFNTDIYAAECCKSGECDWATTCCAYSLGAFDLTAPATKCGKGVSYVTCEYNSLSPTNSLCVTHRFESGFTMNVRCTDNPGETESIYFTTAGATTAWPGLPRLTGSNGPPTSTPAATVTITDAVAPSGPSGGAIAGSVVGGTVLGALLASAVLLGLHVRQRRKREVDPVQPQMERRGGAPEYAYVPGRQEMDGVAGGASPPQELSVGPATPAPAYAVQETEQGHRLGVWHGGK